MPKNFTVGKQDPCVVCERMHVSMHTLFALIFLVGFVYCAQTLMNLLTQYFDFLQ